MGIDVRDLPAIGQIVRPWSNAEICTRIHVVPPEKLGRRMSGTLLTKRLPDFLALDKMVGLLPKMVFS